MLLILDEPVSGLDPHGIRQVRETIEAYRANGGTVFISSHILSEIERSADRVGILHEGRLLIEDTLDGIRRRLGQGRRFVVELDRVPPTLEARLRDEPLVLELNAPNGRQRAADGPRRHRRRPRRDLEHHHRLGRDHPRHAQRADEPGRSLRHDHHPERQPAGGRGRVKTASQVESRESEVGSAEETAADQIPDRPVIPSPHHPITPSPSSLRWRATRTIARQEVRDAVFGWSLYLTAAVGVLIGTLLVYNVLQAVAESGLQIVGRPLYGSVLAVASLAAVFLAGWAALSIARSRDQGALRVLFFAPVDAVSLLGGHALAALAMYGLLMLLTVPALALLAWLVNLPFPPQLFLGVLVSPAFVAPAVGIGLFLSAIAGTARGAMFMFGVIVVVALAIQFGYGALAQSPPDSPYYDALLFLRDLLRAARDALRWISPLALISEGLDAALRDNWRELGRYVVAGLAGGAVWLALAGWALRRRGVLP